MSPFRRLFLCALVGLGPVPFSLRAADPVLPTPDAVASPLPPPAPVAEDAAPALSADACPTARPPCGPRIRVIVPPPVITFRKVCAPPAAPSCAAGCAAPSPAADNFGSAPPRPAAPAVTTIMVPYTYMAAVPTFGVAPATSPFGFGAAPVGGFGGISQFGGVGPFGGAPPVIPAAGFGAVGTAPNDDLTRLLAAALTKKDAGFGAAPAGDDCKKELAAMNAKIEQIRADLAEYSKAAKENDLRVKDAIIKLSEKIVIVNDKLGDVRDGKTLASTIADLDAKLEKLKKDNNLK